MTDANAPTRKRAIEEPVPSGREIIERVTTATGEWQLQRRPAPDGAGRRDGHYEIICSGVFLMASYNRHSDRQLASLALERVRGDGLRVLVGGLGIGYTAQAALEDPRVKKVDVVEVEPVVVGWHRAYFSELCGRPLDDARTLLVQSDLFEVPMSPRSYDAILLDTDNGPGWLAREENRRIYSPDGLSWFKQALTPRGVLAFWSSDRAEEFARMLAGIGGSVEEFEVPDEVAPGCAGTAWIYLAKRNDGRRE